MIAIWANVSTNRRKWLTTRYMDVNDLGGFFIFMTPELALELFGYLGTGLVLVSFIMRDIKWLRAVNMAGGLISLIYAICVNTMPVVVLNASLICINGIQLVRIILNERKNAAMVKSEGENAYNKEENEKDEEII